MLFDCPMALHCDELELDFRSWSGTFGALAKRVEVIPYEILDKKWEEDATS